MSIHPGRTIGAAIGAVVFLLFFAEIADRMVNPAASATPTAISITVLPR